VYAYYSSVIMLYLISYEYLLSEVFMEVIGDEMHKK